MISIKVKFRASTVSTRIGVIFFQIIQHRVARQIATSYKIYSHEWNDEHDIIRIDKAEYSRRTHLAEIEQKIIRDIDRLYLIASRTNDVTMVMDYYIKSCRENTLFLFAERIANELHAACRVKTAQSHRVSLRSFSIFREGEDLDFNAITPHLIKQYEHYLKTKSLCNNTISFYMRILRAVYNRAVCEGLTTQCFPFKGVYVGVAKTIKRAVDIRVVSRLKSLNLLERNNLAFARDMFLFSFYCRGMSFVDMAHLTHENMKDDRIVYQRHKTGQELNIRIEPCLRAIIVRYRSENNRYLLPILTGDKANYESAIRLQNMRLKQISEIMELSTALTSYVARHSWATLAKRKGVALQIISESMGHNNENTTRIYLASLEKSVIDDVNAKLLSGV